MSCIRSATVADGDAIRRIARDAYAIYVPRIGREPAPMLADFDAQIADGLVHVAVDGDAVAGFVVFYPRDDHMHLENVAVATSAHGRGIGSALVACVEDAARAAHLGRIELYTNEKMTENIPYYLARGYDEVGRWEEDGFNRIFFRKDLA